ncbi:MAG: sugar kinase [Clostridium sp.]|nr:sugar kinase [Clostridium sp.]
MPEIITIGETMAAFTPGSTGYLRYVRNFEMRIAGAESNLAIGASKLGHSTGWVSSLGKDEFGEFVRNSIRAEGVDTSRVVTDPEHRTGIMFKQVRNASETSVFYYRENSAASHLTPDMLDQDYLASSRIIHLTGITPVLSKTCRETVEAAMDTAAKHGIPVSFDPNIRRRLWKDQDYVPMLREMMMKAQIVLLGAEEAKTLLGTEDALKVMDLLFKKGKAGLIAVKDGAKGASVGSPEVFASIPAFPCTCVDPVGAGDAFNAAFLCGILEGKEVEECGRMGAVAGALATETYGDTEGYPSREQMEAALKGQAVIYR